MLLCTVLAVSSVDAEVHHVGDIHNEEHICMGHPAVDPHTRHHFVVTYGHPAKGFGPKSLAELVELLGKDSQPHVVPTRSYVVWSTLHAVHTKAAERGWKCHGVKLMKPHHKRGITGENAGAVDDFSGNVFVYASEDRREHWGLRLKAAGVAFKAIRKVNMEKFEVVGKTVDVAAVVRVVSAIHEVRWVEPEVFASPQNNIATCTVQSDQGLAHPFWDGLPSRLAGEGEVILVADTGLHTESCFFADSEQPIAYYPETNFDHRKVISYKKCVDEEDGTEDSNDGVGHGTHVTGSLCGSLEDKNDKTAAFTGLANDAKIFFADLNCASTGLMKLKVPKDLIEFFNLTHSMGGRISHNSWGYVRPTNVVSLDREADQYSWQNLDYLIVASAGNSQSGGILSPAAAKNVLTVGAHANSPSLLERQEVAPHYAKGPTWDHRIKPEIMAPGYHNVRSADNNKQCGTHELSGTSMASPFVSAGAAITRQYLREGWYPGGIRGMGKEYKSPSGALLKALLLHSARKMSGSASGFEGGVPNNNQGWGMLALHDVLYFKGHKPEVNQYEDNHLFFREGFIQQDHTYSVEFTVSAPGPNTRATDVRVTLVFTDYPAAFGATHATVNDIDLVLMDTEGKMHYGNSEGPIGRHGGLGGNHYDSRNSIEQIEIKAAKPGTYRATVYGYHIAEDEPYHKGQPYALVVTGPTLQTRGVTDSAETRCPNDCLGRGKCDTRTGKCVCKPQYHHVDCGMCAAEVFCHGHGECVEGQDICKCTDPRFTGDHCSECAPALFGANCDNNCLCSGRGSCDTTLPVQERVCRCDSHWTGANCEMCARGWFGEKCDEVAHWCRLDGKPDVISGERSGLIEINSRHKYDNSRHCDWLVKTPGAGFTVELHFQEFDIEGTYDWLYVYEGDHVTYGKHIERFDGRSALKYNQGTGNMTIEGDTYLRFTSDLIGPGKGFLIYFRIVGGCTANTCGLNGVCAAPNGQYLCSCNDLFDPATMCTTCLPGGVGELCKRPIATAAPATQAPPTLEPTSAPIPPTAAPGTPETEAPATPEPVVTAAPTDIPSTESPVICTEKIDCTNRGTCVNGVCECSVGYVGDFCEVTCPGTLFLPASRCQYDGVCSVATYPGVNGESQRIPLPNQNGSYMGQCECTSKYSGFACQLAKNFREQAPPIHGLTLMSVNSNGWHFGTISAAKAGQTGWVQVLVRHHDAGHWRDTLRKTHGDAADSAILHIGAWEKADMLGSIDKVLTHHMWHHELEEATGCSLLNIRGLETFLGAYLEVQGSQGTHHIPLSVEVTPVEGREESFSNYTDVCEGSPQGLLDEQNNVQPLQQMYEGTESPAPQSLDFAGPFAAFAVLGFAVAFIVACAYLYWSARKAERKEQADLEFSRRGKERQEREANTHSEERA